jgi:hypothetical protein
MHQMPQSEERVSVHHPRARIPHHLPDPPAHVRLEAVDPAARADRLFLPESALPDSFLRVPKKVLTIGAGRIVVTPAEHPDHQFHRLYFPRCTVDHGENRFAGYPLRLVWRRSL